MKEVKVSFMREPKIALLGGTSTQYDSRVFIFEGYSPNVNTAFYKEKS